MTAPSGPLNLSVTEDVDQRWPCQRLLANDRDVDFGQSLSAVFETQGNVSLDAQGTFRYTPFAMHGCDTYYG